MERRARKYSGLASPESAREWAEPPSPPPLPQGRKIPVVYYLYRNRHLEHPHFIEVPLSSPDGLYLRDVIDRLDALRGKGMPAMYSWSCKRSYKNGFVWHDLAEDDLVLPANGNEYVLKGSELLDPSPSDRIHQSNGNSRLLNLKPQQQENPAISRTQEAAGSSSSSPASSVIKQPKPPPSPPSPCDDEHSPLLHCPGLGPLPRPPPSWQNSLLGPTEYPAYKSVIAADASTQTDDDGDINARGGMLTDDSSVDLEFDKRRRKHDHRSKERLETSGDAISPAPTSWSNSSSSGSGKMETLESLIRADASKIKSFRMLKEEEEEALFHTKPKLRPTNVLMQLITCGSISLKDHHSFGLVPTYRPRLSHVNLSSTVFGGSMMLGELDYLSEHPRLMGSRVENKECFSGSLIELKKHKNIVREMMLPTLKRSSSYNADRNCKTPDSEQGMDGSRKSSAGLDCREVSQSENQRITLSVDESSASVESTKERKEKACETRHVFFLHQSKAIGSSELETRSCTNHVTDDHHRVASAARLGDEVASHQPWWSRKAQVIHHVPANNKSTPLSGLQLQSIHPSFALSPETLDQVQMDRWILLFPPPVSCVEQPVLSICLPRSQ
ncbi:hypothetical protein OPV22_030380 [Ensete ventricosum]|uniref:SOSEKI DIX-like domain-containing protein n=1 Tax=Ensete ventricosum TaxID=4639 RepID=A0AAV8Q3Y2_ENSVE|nr:hypothetical protein OPV22_030380 [Ensete ventricosum]